MSRPARLPLFPNDHRPARRAWRPAAGPAGRLLLLASPPVAALEALDAAAGVHQLLLAGVKGMAVVAQLGVQLRLGRAGLKFVPAGARHGCDDVIGVNFSLHRMPLLLTAV